MIKYILSNPLTESKKSFYIILIYKLSLGNSQLTLFTKKISYEFMFPRKMYAKSLTF